MQVLHPILGPEKCDCADALVAHSIKAMIATAYFID